MGWRELDKKMKRGIKIKTKAKAKVKRRVKLIIEVLT